MIAQLKIAANESRQLVFTDSQENYLPTGKKWGSLLKKSVLKLDPDALWTESLSLSLSLALHAHAHAHPHTHSCTRTHILSRSLTLPLFFLSIVTLIGFSDSWVLSWPVFKLTVTPVKARALLRRDFSFNSPSRGR